MSAHHPVHTLHDQLEATRLQLVQKIAREGGSVSADSLRELSMVQSSLMAVREEIKAHEPRAGFGGEKALE